MQRLTDLAYWDENWWNRKRPQRLTWLYRDMDYETVRLLAGKAKHDRVRALEVGAGGSRILPYLARKFGFEIFGSDFSLAGCRLARANAALQGVPLRTVCEDLFQSSLAPESFDLVYSAGLVEHFDDTRAAVKEHFRLTKPGGRLVIIVPNFQGAQGRIWKRLAHPLWKVHRVFGPEELAASFRAFGLSEVRTGYLGSFFIHVGMGSEWTGVKRWPKWFQFSVYASIRLTNALISLLFRLSPLRPHTRTLSPLFFTEGVRPTAE